MDTYAEWEPTQVVYSISVVARVEVVTFPTGLNHSPIIAITGRYTVGVSVNANFQLSCFTISNSLTPSTMTRTSTLTPVTLSYGENYIRFTYTRSDVSEVSASCVIETDTGLLSGAIIPG